MNNFHELYTRYAADVYRFALYLCGSASEAEEITAETFARALTTSTPLQHATVKGYLLTVARNLFIENLRRAKKLEEISPELPDHRPQLDSIVEDRTELDALNRQLQKYSEIDRAALLLRADGLAYEEIGKTLNISIAAAKVKVHRLRLKLAEWRAGRDEGTRIKEQGTKP